MGEVGPLDAALAAAEVLVAAFAAADWARIASFFECFVVRQSARPDLAVLLSWIINSAGVTLIAHAPLKIAVQAIR